jgi:hypothetical protein
LSRGRISNAKGTADGIKTKLLSFVEGDADENNGVVRIMLMIIF